jgi:hypothetical protein
MHKNGNGRPWTQKQNIQPQFEEEGITYFSLRLWFSK